MSNKAHFISDTLKNDIDVLHISDAHLFDAEHNKSDWRSELLSLLIKENAIDNDGFSLFFLEQDWAADKEPTEVRIKGESHCPVPMYPQWPNDKNTLVITMPSEYGVAGYHLPAITVARCVYEKQTYKLVVDDILKRLGIDSELFEVPLMQSPSDNHWLVGFQCPRENDSVDGWLVTRIYGHHIDLIHNSDGYDEYFELSKDFPHPHQIAPIYRNLVWSVHNLVLAVVNGAARVNQRNGVAVSGSISMCGQAITTLAIEV